MGFSKFFGGFKQKDNYNWDYFITKAVPNNWGAEVNRILAEKPEFAMKEESFAIILASAKGHLDIVKKLHEMGAIVDNNAVAQSIVEKRDKVLSYFEEKGIDLSGGIEMAVCIEDKKKQRADRIKKISGKKL